MRSRVAYFGGPVFVLFWAVAALGVLWEWQTLVCAHDRDPVLTLGIVTLVGAALLVAFGWPGTAVALVALGALGMAALASRVRAILVRRRACSMPQPC